MKKTAAIAAILALMSAPVFAANQGGFSGPTAAQTQTSTASQGGFVDANASTTTVAQVKEMKDNSWVKLRGTLVERQSDERYLFRDASGTISVDIDHKLWNGQTISPQDQVEIQGKVDKEWSDLEIDVKQIQKVSQ